MGKMIIPGLLAYSHWTGQGGLLTINKKGTRPPWLGGNRAGAARKAPPFRDCQVKGLRFTAPAHRYMDRGFSFSLWATWRLVPVTGPRLQR